MGALVTKALRPVRSFNIENRAHRVISKEKPAAAPKYPSNLEDLKRAIKADPGLEIRLNEKDPDLFNRLKDVYVTSHGRPEDDVTRDIKSDKLLPQDTKRVSDYEFGFKEPEKITYGRTTLRHAINFISAHQINPEEVTVSKIALEYKLKEEDVVDILKYFKTYDIYLPKTKNTEAMFAGPSTLRKQLYKSEAKGIEEKKISDSESEVNKDIKELIDTFKIKKKNS